MFGTEGDPLLVHLKFGSLLSLAQTLWIVCQHKSSTLGYRILETATLGYSHLSHAAPPMRQLQQAVQFIRSSFKFASMKMYLVCAQDRPYSVSAFLKESHKGATEFSERLNNAAVCWMVRQSICLTQPENCLTIKIQVYSLHVTSRRFYF